MGGDNESVLKAEKTENQNTGIVLKADKKKKKKKNPISQTQSIRQHVSGSEVHFHADDDRLKVAIPTAEWWNAVRSLNKFQSFSYVDEKNKAIGTFEPFLADGIIEVSVKIEPIQIGPRLEALLNLAKK